MDLEIVQIEWLGYILSEPMTFITDMFVSGFCFFWCYRFRLMKDFPGKKLWWLFFLAMGLTALVGGIAHLLFEYYGMSLKMASWIVSGIVVFAAQVATFQLLDIKLKKLLTALCFLEFGVFYVVLYHFSSFEVVKFNSFFGLVLVVSLIHFKLFLKNGNEGSKWITIGITSNILAALINTFKFSFHSWFTYHDIGHVIMIVSLYFMYRGVKVFGQENELQQGVYEK